MKKCSPLLLCFLLLTAAACDTHDQSKPAEPKPQALALDGFQFTSFRAVPWESPCAGLKSFFNDFQKNHMPDVTLTINDSFCDFGYRDRSSAFYGMNLNFAREGHELEVYASAGVGLDPKTQVLSIHQASLTRKTSETTSADYRFQADDALISGNMFNLQKTYDAWMQGEPGKTATVFGRSYAVFSAEVAQKYGEAGSTLEVRTGITLHLIPNADDIGAGKVRFVAATPDSFSTPFFGCSDLECLNAGKAHYVLVGGSLSIGSGPLTSAQASFHEEFRTVHFTEWNP